MTEVTEVLRLPLQNAGAILANLDPVVINELDTQINFLLKNKKLAGKMSSYTHPVGGQLSNQINFVPKSQLNLFLQKLLDVYNKQYNLNFESKISNHIAWLNLQKKYEYNPNHNHNGDVSYVLWYKIPFELENEDKAENTINSGIKTNGRFSFSYVNKNNEISFKLLNVDKHYENKVMMFPSNLVHCVYPFFTSDDYRISLSGNIWL